MARARTLLLVDDDEEFRFLLGELLEEEGCLVRHASQGKEALALLEAWTPDLILMDLMMPEMSGWELFDALQGREAWRNIPIAIVSASPRECPPGALQVIGKPIDLPNLLGLLDAIEAPSVPSVYNAAERLR
jgi:CheY-like chemotaxis protein